MATREAEDACALCRGKLQDARMLDCGHVFCLTCVETLRTGRAVTCPTCDKDTDLPARLQVTDLPRGRVTQVTNNLDDSHAVAGGLGDSAARRGDLGDRAAVGGNLEERDAGGGALKDRDDRKGDLDDRAAGGGNLEDRDTAGGDLEDRDAGGGARPVSLRHVIRTDREVVSVAVDEGLGVVYAGLVCERHPVVMYGLDGQHRWPVSSCPALTATRLALDARRGLLLAAASRAVHRLDSRGAALPALRYPEFRHLDNVAHHAGLDVYLAADVGARCVLYLDPRAPRAVRAVPAPSAPEWRRGSHLSLCCDRTGSTSSWAVSDAAANLIRVFDVDGRCTRWYGRKGRGEAEFDHPHGMCMDGRGRILLSDRNNHRIVGLDPARAGRQGEWRLVTDTRGFRLGAPRKLQVTGDGVGVVSMWDTRPGPFHIGIFSGLQL